MTLNPENNTSYEYAVIVPVYNSQTTLENLLDSCKSFFSETTFQLIFIDDCSADGSWKTLEKIQSENKNVTIIQLETNAGQHTATYCGLMFSKATFCITIDDDLQVNPKEIQKLIDAQKVENADLVYGIYSEKQHNKVRNLGSKLVGFFLHKFASTPAIGSSFKLIHNSLVEQLKVHNHQNIYLDELLGWYSQKTSFVHVEHSKRQSGKSGYSFLKLFSMTSSLFVNYTALPLKLITYFGILSSLISFGFGIYFIYQKFNFGASLGFTSTIVAVFFSTGLILLSLGIIGEYLNKIFLMQIGKPPFKIKQIIKK